MKRTIPVRKDTIFFFAALFFSLILLLPKKHIRVYMIGDSTLCMYAADRSPVTGWGMPFMNFFDSSVTVLNKAQSGRSTRTFIEENFWQPIADSLHEGDYVFIQFGHNDEVPEKKSYTTEKQFQELLSKYVQETRSKGAIPILLTPLARRHFDSTGKIKETHPVYAELLKEVAARYTVPLIDMNKKSQELLQSMGSANSELLYNHLKPGENPHYPDGIDDNSHLNELGARLMAELVLKELKVLELELADRIFIPNE